MKSVEQYLAQEVPVGKYLADQLLVPMVLAGGGRFRTLSPTKHTMTNAEIIKKFIDLKITLNEYDQNRWEIEVWNG